MTEPELEEAARAVRDRARREDTQTIKDAVWQSLPEPSAPRRRYLPALATGAAGVTLAGVAVWAASLWLPGAPMAPAPAFARVEEALRDVQTAQWTSNFTWTTQAYGQNATVVQKSVKSYNYLRLGSKPLLVGTDRLKAAHPTNYSINNGAFSIRYIREPQGTGYARYDAYAPYYLRQTASVQERFRSLILFPRDVSARSPGKEAQVNGRYVFSGTTTHTPWISSSTTLNGSAALMWSSVWTTNYPSYSINSNNSTPAFKEQISISLWVDPVTFRVLRSEHDITAHNGRVRSRMINENFRYNVPISAQTFQLPLPATGVPYLYTEFTRTGKKAFAPLPQERRQVEAVVRQAVAAWNRHDGKAFVQTWDWKRFVPTERNTWFLGKRHEYPTGQEGWRTQAAKGIPYRRWRITGIRHERTWQGWFVRSKASDGIPPRSRPLDFDVVAMGVVQVKAGGPWVPLDARISLYRGSKGFRITQVHIADKWMPDEWPFDPH